MEYYKEVIKGNKLFEIRYNDRNYKVGDKIQFYQHSDDLYLITYITDYQQRDNYVVLGIRKEVIKWVIRVEVETDTRVIAIWNAVIRINKEVGLYQEVEKENKGS